MKSALSYFTLPVKTERVKTSPVFNLGICANGFNLNCNLSVFKVKTEITSVIVFRSISLLQREYTFSVLVWKNDKDRVNTR